MKRMLIVYPLVVAVSCVAALVLDLYEPLSNWHEWLFRFLASIAFSGGAVFAVGVARDALRLDRERAKFDEQRKLVELLPVSVHMVDFDETKQTAIIERGNGEIVTIELPPDYDPRQDNGRRLIEPLLPPDYKLGDDD